MIDLSSNNPSPVDFDKVRSHGTARVYIKLSEGVNYLNPEHQRQHAAALKAGMKVGEYHFAHPEQNTAAKEAEYFCRLLPELRPGHALRPVLDLEAGKPSRAVGQWAEEFVAFVRHHTGHTTVIYSNPAYLAGCELRRVIGPLWLASYGRDDGKEYPFTIPHPWRRVAAHQYFTKGTTPGVIGPVDLSRVLHPLELDVHRWPLPR